MIDQLMMQGFIWGFQYEEFEELSIYVRSSELQIGNPNTPEREETVRIVKIELEGTGIEALD